MKLFMLFAVAALIVGGIYHTELSEYLSGLAGGSSGSGGGSVAGSMQDMGSANNGLIGGAGGALGR